MTTPSPNPMLFTEVAALLTVPTGSTDGWDAPLKNAIRNLRDALIQVNTGRVQTVRWIKGNPGAWQAASTDPTITRHYISTNDPLATAPTHYSDYDQWFRDQT